MASSSSKNPFYTEEDDDFGFSGRKAVAGASENRYQANKRDPFLDDDDFETPLSPYEELQRQKQMSMNRQLDGTQRIMASIYESERMGVATAEELVQQGEQLDNVENKLDGINQSTKVSQRHLNNIKSIFGGIKNWWKGEQKEPTISEERPTRRPETSLQSSVSASNDINPPTKYDHPGMRDTRAFYDEDAPQQQQKVMNPDRQRYEEQLEKNLDTMSEGLARLKGLGLGLGEEIQAQNDQIERITSKTERADTTIKDQNRQIRHILGK